MGLAAGAGLALGAGAVSPAAAQPQGSPQPAGRKSSPITILVLLFDGFEVTDALAPFDTWKIAGHLGAPIETRLVTLNDVLEVTAFDGVIVKRRDLFLRNADILVVPGAPLLVRNNTMPPGLASLLTTWRHERRTLATVCNGAVLAARAGVLTGRNVGTHHFSHDAIEALGVNLVKARVVDDGDIISSGGVTSGIDLALHVIERYAGPQLALATEDVLEYERRGTVWRRP